MSNTIAACAVGTLVPAAEDDHTHFHVLITPHRSLSQRGLLVLLGAITVVTSLVALVAAVAGLWPVGILVVFDGLLLAVVIVAGRRRLDREERVIVRDGSIHVSRTARGRPAGRFTMPTWSLGIVSHDDPDYGCRSLRLVQGRRSLEIGRDLSPPERETLRAALVAALRRDGARPRLETHRALPLAA